MNDDEKKQVIDHYSERLQKFGHHPSTLGWTKGKHSLRYKILLESFQIKDKTLLDFGCGFGDMYDYLTKNDLGCNYEGIDVNPKLIEQGLVIYAQAKLHCEDALANGLKKKYDFIVSSGVHNLKLADNKKFINQTFDLFNEYATEGFALNFLSDQVDYKYDHTYHANPAEILSLAYKYSKRVTLRNDYMPFEFTISVNKRDVFSKTTAVYPEFEKDLNDDQNSLFSKKE